METMKISLKLVVGWIGNKKFCSPEEVLLYVDDAIITSETALVEDFLRAVFKRDDINADLAFSKAYNLKEVYQKKAVWETLFAREDIPLSEISKAEKKLGGENKPSFLKNLSEIILLRKDLSPKEVIEKLISRDIRFDVIRKRSDIQKFFETGTTPAEAISYAKKIGDDDLWRKIFNRKDVQEYLKP